MTDVRQVAGRTAHTIPSGKPSPLLRRMARRADALIFIMRASGTSRNVGQLARTIAKSANREFRDVNPQVVVQELGF